VNKRPDIATAEGLTQSRAGAASGPRNANHTKEKNMKRIRLLGLALIAVFALGALASASAFAENPEILPVPTETSPAKFTATLSATKLVVTKEKVEVECKKGKAKGSFTTQDAGTVDVTFEECKGLVGTNSAVCTSSGAAEGSILTEGTVQLVDILPAGTLELGVWIKPNEDGSPATDLHFKCGAVAEFVVLGSVIGKTNAKDLVKIKETTLTYEQSTRGEQAIKSCMFLKALCINAEGKENIFMLETEFGKGHLLAAFVGTGTIKPEPEIEVHF
jgi:hypothetical protein